MRTEDKIDKFLNELAMKASTQITYYKNTSKLFAARIHLEGGRFFIFEAEKINEYEFDKEYGDGMPEELVFDEDGNYFGNRSIIWDIVFTDEEGDIEQKQTDRRVALQLFAALQEVFKEFIKRKNPKLFCMAAANYEPSRVKLYKTIVKKIKGYSVSTKNYKDYGFLIWFFKK
jgi:hypothetical protein